MALTGNFDPQLCKPSAGGEGRRHDLRRQSRSREGIVTAIEFQLDQALEPFSQRRIEFSTVMDIRPASIPKVGRYEVWEPIPDEP